MCDRLAVSTQNGNHTATILVDKPLHALQKLPAMSMQRQLISDSLRATRTDDLL